MKDLNYLCDIKYNRAPYIDPKNTFMNTKINFDDISHE